MKQWLIAWRNLKRRKLRTFLTMLSIVIGVASTFAVIAAVSTAEKTIPIYLKEAYAKADYNIAGTDAYFSEDILKEMEKNEDSTSVGVLKENTKIIPSQDGISAIQKRVVLTGYSNLDTKVTNFKVIDGDLSVDGAVITDKTAKAWEKTVGDTISFDTEKGIKEIKITAIVKYTQELMGPASWMMAKYHHWAVALPLSVVQDWFDLGNKVQAVQVRADSPDKLKVIENEINQLVNNNSDVYMQPVIVNFENEQKDINTFFMALYLAGFLGIVLSAFIIFNSLYVSIKERKNEFAVLKTIGYTPGQLQGMVLLEVLLLAIIGTVFGLGIGFLLALGLKALMFMLFGIHGESDLLFTTGLIVSSLAGLLVPLLASWIPIQNVGKISVVDVMKENKREGSGNKKWLGFIGILLIISSFFIKNLLVVLPLMVGIVLLYPYLFKMFNFLLKGFYRIVFRFSGDVANRNLNRNLNRSSTTSVILCLGIAMILLMSSLNSAILQTYERIIHASYGGNLDIMFHHIEEDDLEKIRNTDAVKDAEIYSIQPVVWNLNGEKRALPVFAVEEEWIDRFPLFTGPEGSQSKIIEKLKENEIVMDKISFDVWGGKLGESISLETLDGEQSFKVVDVVNTMKNNGYTAFMKEEQFKEKIGVKYERNALIIKDESTSPLQLRENIYGQFGERVEEMWGPEDWVTVIGSSITGTFSIVNILVVLAIIVSGIGITNTLLINIMERVREIGMMRAVGVTRKQIISMIMLEGLGIGLAATVIGILFGTLLIYFTSGFVEIKSLTFDFGVSWLIMGLIFLFGIIVSLISSFTPSRKAAKTPLNEALRYE